jgi:hypothetical protein
MQKFYKKVVQNRGKDGLDMVVIKGEKKKERREEEKRTVCHKCQT